MRSIRDGAPQRAARPRRRRTAALAVVVATACTGPVGAADAAPITKPKWVNGVTITEYFPTLERWFVGRKVAAPGLSGAFRVDWLYSARGVTMEGDGIGLDGRNYHVSAVGNGGWVDSLGRPSSVGAPIFWRAGGYWLNAKRKLTYPLEVGGWSNDVGKKYVPLRNVRFAEGMSLPLKPWRSLAVDLGLIKRGSRVFIPAYKHTPGGGWFLAQDTGGAIRGKHVDVYRTPPSSPDGASTTTGARMYVIPVGTRAPKSAPQPSTAPKPSTAPAPSSRPTPSVGGGTTAP